MDPPDIFDQAAIAASLHATANSTGNKRARSDEPTLADLYSIAKDIENRSKHKVGAELSKDERFRSFFGCGAEVALITWKRMVRHDLLPREVEDASILHFMWALFFMMVYPGDKAASALAGGSQGAIDPKTLRKYVWPMIRAIASLEPFVVSLFILYSNFFVDTILTPVKDSTRKQVQT